MKKLIISLVLILMLFSTGYALPVIEGLPDRPVTLTHGPQIYTGILKGITYNPNYLLVDGTRFNWEIQKTRFLNSRGKRISPPDFVKALKGRGIALTFHEDGICKEVKPSFF